MKIHEYQAKELFRQYGIATTTGDVATTPDEVKHLAETFGGKVVIKAQVHTGGRGKAGGVKLVHSSDEAWQTASQMIGMTLVTKQTGPQGIKVVKVLVEKVSDIEKEFYLSMIVDRTTAKVVIIASTEGGMDIEEVAEKSPEKIIKEFIDPLIGIQAYHTRNVAYALGLAGEAHKTACKMITGLYRLFVEKDCSLVEINPLILTKTGELLALDGKISFDSNALYRHPDIVEMRDTAEEDPLEVEASKYRLNYIKLDGTVGCMVNGAGLAMATMDIIKLYGAAPANFLDVGGSANEEAITNAFRIILSDENVKAIFINIFGGILKCDVLASGVLKAAEKLSIKIPIVVRMQGTNVEQAKQLLKNSSLQFKIGDTLQEGAELVAQQVLTVK